MNGRNGPPRPSPQSRISLDADCTTSAGRASVPHVLILLPLEGRPLVMASCLTDADERRLADWLAADAARARLVDDARRLARAA